LIGKVLRGTNAGRLLYYLYGPGKANEHTDPHLVAGFSDPAELEPERRPDGSRDLRRLSGLLAQPLAAMAGSGYDKPVWHCSIRAAPGDRMLSDAEWAQVAAGVMDRTGLAPGGDDQGVRWVAVRHAADHIHLVATLARQDGTRPKVWNDFYRVREACRDAEERFGLRVTAAADRTAARRPARSETEQAARRGWGEPPRVTLRREVSVAAAGAGTEQEFFAGLASAGVAVRRRYSIVNPGEVTGYAVGLRHHTAKDGQVIWYGGGKLAADLSLPKLRARWAGPGADQGAFCGRGLSAGAARAVLRRAVTSVADRASDEAGFFAGLREAGVLVRLRFSEIHPGQVTGYSVALPGQDGGDGPPLWFGGGRLSAALTLPRLRNRWDRSRNGTPDQGGAFRFTFPERNAIFEHAARQAADAADHIRRSARGDPAGAGDAAWAAADTLHVAARALGSPVLRRAADSYDRAGRARYGRVPRRTREGSQLRAAARLMSMAGWAGGGGTLVTAALLANLVALAIAVAELREAQQFAAQAAAARAAAGHLQAGLVQARSSAPRAGQVATMGRRQPGSAADAGRRDFPVQVRLGRVPDAAAGRSGPRPGRGLLPAQRAGPGR
jgi:MobA/VirD2-like, nuclease domain